LATALATDALQLLLGPLGWIGVDEGLDVVAMVLTSMALGFHMLLLPTFILELIPGPDLFPTWTGCTAAVILLRKRAQSAPPLPVQLQGSTDRLPIAKEPASD
jgi:hypothetical protein